jgi:menaquinone-dependent protoporphyrinogen oxidase
MTRVLVTYVTNAGSTAEVAEFVGRELSQSGQAGLKVDVLPVKRVRDVGIYDSVVVGGPMTIGWHREAQRFLQDNQPTLQRIPVALFLTALSLTVTPESGLESVPVFADPSLAKPARHAGKLSLHESFTTVRSYLVPVLKKAPSIAPVSVGFFAGKLDYGKLSLLRRLFVRVVIGATAGDFRNWDAIEGWTFELRPRLLKAEQPVVGSGSSSRQ